MKNWDHKEINKLAERMNPQEDMVIRHINLFLEPSYFAVPHIHETKGEFAHKDCDIIYYGGRKQIDTMYTVEIEVGQTQKNWKNKIPRKSWPYGLNILARKKPYNFDYFLKVSPTLESAFLIDSKWFADEVKAGNIKKQKIKHSLKFNTCDEVYSIPWKMVDDNPVNVVLMEDDNWERIATGIIIPF